MASGARPADLAGVAAILEETVPPLVALLLEERPGRVHRETLALLERPLLAHVLALTGGNQLRAARLLGLNRNTLRARCRALGLVVSRRRPAARGASSGAPR